MKHCYWLLLLLLGTVCAQAQNINTTFRSKLVYPGQTLANIWGYVGADGSEYALLGGSLGLIIVNVTNPDNPQAITQIPGPNSLWKEIKTYGNYAYVVSEGGQGIQIFNLSGLPSATVPSKFYTGDGAVAGQMNRIHALHIDTAQGYLYAYGGNIFSGGAKIFNLNPDPWNPTYAGKFDQLGYIHDGYVNNDTLYSGHIYLGQFAIVDMTDKSNPQLLATQTTPGAFTHNTWPTNDSKTILSTDEVNNSVLAAYDVSDPTDIKELDRIQSNPGSNSVVHNTHIQGDFAITSWYKDGFTIVDLSRPHNLIQTGNHDTYVGTGGTGSGFNGCWGVYPHFPSGNIMATNISAPGSNNNGELWIVTPNYVKGCYLEGQVRDAATLLPITGATIAVPGIPLLGATSGPDGRFASGQVTEAVVDVNITKSGYQDAHFTTSLENGVLRYLDVLMFSEGSLNITGVVLRDGKFGPKPVADATVYLYGVELEYSALTDAFGNFLFPDVSPGYYDLVASKDPTGMAIMYNQILVKDSTFTLLLQPNHKRNGSPGTSVAPNPFSSETVLTVDLPEAGYAARLTDLLGREVMRFEVQEKNSHIVFGSELRPGMYWLHLEKNGASEPPVSIIKH